MEPGGGAQQQATDWLGELAALPTATVALLALLLLALLCACGCLLIAAGLHLALSRADGLVVRPGSRSHRQHQRLRSAPDEADLHGLQAEAEAEAGPPRGSVINEDSIELTSCDSAAAAPAVV